MRREGWVAPPPTSPFPGRPSLLIWASSIVSAFLDNIPYTVTLVPVLRQLSDEDRLGLDLKVLAWALCFGACLGGNGSLIGASANVVVSAIAKREGYDISFKAFIKVCLYQHAYH